MNLYEIRDATGKAVEPVLSVSLKEAAARTGYSTQALSCAYCQGYAIQGKYKLQQVDVTIKRTDAIWIDWELRRAWLLKLCGR